MSINEIESKIIELKAKQSDFFKKKKADRTDADKEALEATREELKGLKSQAKEVYNKK